MPALFDVPGWSVPSAPVSTQPQSKKRKRTVSSEEQELLRNAQANFDKLIHSLGGNDDPNDGLPKKKGTKKFNKPTSQPSHRDQHQRGLGEGREGIRPQGNPHNQKKAPVSPAVDPSTTSNKAALSSKKGKKKNAKHVVQHTDTPKPSAVVQDSLTPLQQNLKKSLDGARFRFVPRSMEVHWVDLYADLDY